MAVSTMLHQLGQRRDLNIVTYLVTALSQARILPPPSLQQYVFIHEVTRGQQVASDRHLLSSIVQVLADAVMSGNTTVDKTGLVSFLHSLDDRAGKYGVKIKMEWR